MPLNASSILMHSGKVIKTNIYEFLKDVADTFRFTHYHIVPEVSKKTELEFNIV